MALELKVVTDLVNKYADQLGQEALAEIGEALLTADVPLDTSEVETLKTQLQEQIDGRAKDKAEYVEKINKFIYGGETPDDKPDDEGDPEKPPIDTVEEFEEYADLNEMVYGKED